MDSVSTTKSVTSSNRTIYQDIWKLCRFCFNPMMDGEPHIDVFTSKIGTATILEIVKNYFAIFEETSYEQYLNGRSWTTNHIEIRNFQLNTEKHGLSCICANCLQVVIESSWFADRLRTHSIKSLATSTLCTVLSNCTLIATHGDVVNNDKVMPTWNYERRRITDDLANFWDACIFCFQHNSSLLFDIFLSTIMGNKIVDIIKICSTSCKQEHIYEQIHLKKSHQKTITVVDFQWRIADSKVTPRKICLNCVIPIVRLAAFMERVRRTNEAVPFMELTNQLDGLIEINVPYGNLQDILSSCIFMTTAFTIIPTSHIWEVLTEMAMIKKEDIGHTTKPLDCILELQEPNVSTTTTMVEEEIIFCKYCNKLIYGCSSIEDHVLQCLEEDVVHTVDIHNRALCNNCIDVVYKKEEIMSKLPIESFKHCSICKLSLYKTRNAGDADLTLRGFLAKYFK